MAISLKVDLNEVARVSTTVVKVVDTTQAQVTKAAETTAVRIQDRVRADIRGAGNFGARWTDGFRVEVDSENPNTVTLTGTMDVPYWRVFQYGAVIRGKPFLWFAPTPGTVKPDKFGLTPKVIKKRSVTIPKKFHIVEIAEDEIKKIGETLEQLKPE